MHLKRQSFQLEQHYIAEIEFVCLILALEYLFLRTRRRSTRHCIKLKGKRPKAEYKAEQEGGKQRTNNGAHPHREQLLNLSGTSWRTKFRVHLTNANME
jgi:hypothetical protein